MKAVSQTHTTHAHTMSNGTKNCIEPWQLFMPPQPPSDNAITHTHPLFSHINCAVDMAQQMTRCLQNIQFAFHIMDKLYHTFNYYNTD